MKAISLIQPWATLVAIGAKKIETRSWSTNYRGPLAIHASRSFPDAVCLEEPFRTALGDMVPEELPLGAVLAVCSLVDCRRIDDKFKLPEEPELSFGDFTPGRFAWYLEGVKLLSEPILIRGHLGLWDWERD